MSRVVLIVAGALTQATGGYRYDAAMVAGLRELGWSVDVVELAGEFPIADDRGEASLAAALSECPDNALVVIDALAGSGLPAVVGAHRDRLRLIALVHHALADETGLAAADRNDLLARERKTLAAVSSVITTSAYTARRLVSLGLVSHQPAVVPPGVAAAPLAEPIAGHPPQLLCVATLTPRKGQTVLIDALARLVDLNWRCRLVGADDRDWAYAAKVDRRIEQHTLQDRIDRFATVDEHILAECYRHSDVFILPSYFEGHGMVIDEAIAHGLAIVTTTGGALADTLPADAGIAVEPGDSRALATALQSMLTDDAVFSRAQDGARRARRDQISWPQRAREMSRHLSSHRPAPIFS